jgi:hypothetical protein
LVSDLLVDNKSLIYFSNLIILMVFAQFVY